MGFLVREESNRERPCGYNEGQTGQQELRQEVRSYSASREHSSLYLELLLAGGNSCKTQQRARVGDARCFHTAHL